MMSAQSPTSPRPRVFLLGIATSVLGVACAIVGSQSGATNAALGGVMVAVGGMLITIVGAFRLLDSIGGSAAPPAPTTGLCPRCTQPLVGRGAAFCPRCGLKVE